MSDPTASLGSAIRPSPVDVRPAKDEKELKERESAFAAFFRRPEVISGLTQFAAQALQPFGPGQTQAGQIGLAVAQGAEAASRASESQRAQATEQQKLALEERRVVATESEAATAQQKAETEAEAQAATTARGEREITLRENQADVDREFRERRLEFDKNTQSSLAKFREAEALFQQQQVQLSAARNEIERQKLQQQAEQAALARDAAAENLATRLAVQLNISQDQQAVGLITAITRAEIQNSVLTNQPPDINKIIATVRTSLEAAGRLQGTGAGAPGSQGSAAPGSGSPLSAFNVDALTPEQKAAIFANPSNEAAARRAFGDERIDKLKQEVQGQQ